MLFIELFAPKGALSEEQRRRLSQRLVTELVAAEGTPPGVIERIRGISWLVVHEPDVWTVGGRAVESTEDPRYVVRVSVPAGHLHDGMRAEIVTRITRVLAQVDDDPQRLYQQPDAWVHIVELSEGNTGAFGQVVRTADIVKLTVQGKRPEAVVPSAEPPSTAVDPICGMTVTLTDTAITLEHDGTTYAFCATACRDLFAAQRQSATGSRRS
jgi:YHS domain-containing protein